MIAIWVMFALLMVAILVGGFAWVVFAVAAAVVALQLPWEIEP